MGKSEIEVLTAESIPGNIKPENTRAVYNLDPNTGAPAPIGDRKEGMSPFGCYDMAGKAWEWCEDWYEEA